MTIDLALRRHPQGAVPRVGILNLMPEAVRYEDVLLAQFASSRAFEPVWIRVPSRLYSRDDAAAIRRRYPLLLEAVHEEPLSGLVVTGAAVEHLPFSEVRFLEEIAAAVGHARQHAVPVLGLCWGALAVAYLILGMPHRVLQRKVSGVFDTELRTPASAIARGLDDRFWTAHSRYAGFDEDAIATAEAAGTLRVVAYAPGAGTVIGEIPGSDVVMHIGHPEYPAGRLAEEYRRDLAAGVDGVRPPDNVDVDRPVCLWRSHSQVFFANWVELVHEVRDGRATEERKALR